MHIKKLVGVFGHFLFSFMINSLPEISINENYQSFIKTTSLLVTSLTKEFTHLLRYNIISTRNTFGIIWKTTAGGTITKKKTYGIP